MTTQRLLPRMTPLRLAFRWAAGRSLDGYTRTDATFWHDAEKVLTSTKHCGQWATLAGVKKSAIRNACLVYVASALVLPRLLAALILATAIAYQVWRAVRWARNWWLYRGVLQPVKARLSEDVGWPKCVPAWKWLHIPLGYDKQPGVTISVDLRPSTGKDDTAKDRIVSILTETLAARINTADVSWQFRGRKPRLVIHLEWPPPGEAWFVDHTDRIGKLSEGQVLLGVGGRDSSVLADFRKEHPHLLVAGITGGGKSTILSSIGAQLAHQGVFVVVLDPKHVSLHHFTDLPNVLYCGGAAKCHDGLLALQQEMHRRYELLASVRYGKQRPDIGPRIAVLGEESNELAEELRIHWQKLQGTRSNPPSLAALRGLRFMAREAKLHQVTVAQDGTASALGGGDARNQFGVIVIRGNKNSWGKVAPGFKDPPAESPIRGRWHVFRYGKAVETQMLGFHGEQHGVQDGLEAREWASNGALAECPTSLRALYARQGAVVGHDPGQDVGQGWGAATVHGQRPNLHVVHTDGTVDITDGIVNGRYGPHSAQRADSVTLYAAVEDGTLSVSLDAALRAANRGKFGPSDGTDGKRNTYPRAALQAWEAERSVKVGASA